MASFDFSRESIPVRFAGAVGLAVAAMLLRWALNPVLGANFPYFLAFFAVLLSARWFGLLPGLLAMFVGSLPSVYMLVFDRQPIPPFSVRYWLTPAGAYAAVGLLVWLIDRQRRMSAVVQTTARLADQRLEQLGVEVANKEKEQRLSAQLRAIVESSEDAIISKDLSGLIQSWNYGAEQIFGYTAEEAIGQPISLVVPPDRTHEE